MKRLFLALIILLILTACGTTEDTIQEEETQTNTLVLNELSLIYPDWDMEIAEGSLLNIKNGICTINLKSYDNNARDFYNYLASTMKDSLISKDDTNMVLESTSMYSIFLIKTKTQVIKCNDKTYQLTAFCENSSFRTNKDLLDTTFNSLKCETEYYEDSVSTEVTYITYADEDFTITIPELDVQYEISDDNFLTTQTAGCQISVMHYNAPIDFFYEYIGTYYEENGIDVLEENGYEYVYTAEYQGYDFMAHTVMEYCNYMTYVTSVNCEENYYEDNQDVVQTILNSIDCAQVYTVPEEVIVDEGEDPEPAPIAEDIVETNAGLEYGINPEWVVYFLNENEIAVIIFFDYAKINLIIENSDGDDIELKADLENGQVVKLRDGLHEDAGLSVYIPLQDALNLFSNAANINIGNLIAFALNVRTEPIAAKQEIINKILSSF
ncbi:MAG: hypothetical protein ABIF40_00790 [archaeon]